MSNGTRLFAFVSKEHLGGSSARDSLPARDGFGVCIIAMKLPQNGLSRGELFERMDQLSREDANWRQGKTFSLVYYAGDEMLEVVKEAYLRFFSENALNPMAFPSLRRFESEVLGMTASLFHGDTETAGTMTSGGSESILMAVKTARDFARAHRPQVKKPRMLLPLSAHPAFEKAAHYFDVEPVHIPLAADYRADAAEARKLVDENTILMVGSAPAYPHGVVDPIEELAAIAKEAGILFHTDACLGGFLLPFAERLGHNVPLFDFRVPGVTSISADLHKYGFAAKGASTVLYRNRELRRFQYYAYANWPGGLYGSPSMTGTRPGGAIAAAWAALNFAGEDGYVNLARRILDTSKRILDGIRAISGLRVLGEPPYSVFAFTSDIVDIYALGDAMEARGWKLDRQQRPPALHMMITPAHEKLVPQFLADLREAKESLEEGKLTPEGSAAMYGMLGSMEARDQVEQLILQFMDGLDS